MKKIYHTPQTVVYTISGNHPLANSTMDTLKADDKTEVDEYFTNKKRKDTPHPIWG